MDILLGLIIVTIISVFIYKDAEKRGMCGIGWALGVWLLLIVFLPLYLIVRTPIKESK